VGSLTLASAVQAAPYVLSFSGQIRDRLVEGRLEIGDLVEGRIYYDTNLSDTDPAGHWGQFPGATADVTVADLAFSLQGAMFTNADVVFGFSAQTVTEGPPSLLEFVEVGLYADVFPGFGAALPIDSSRFRGVPEVTFNFRSVRDGVGYYDVVTAHVTRYSISPVPEPTGMLAFMAGLAVVCCWRRALASPRNLEN
jgi:hypothetical protein